jgi:hypothetical protein
MRSKKACFVIDANAWTTEIEEPREPVQDGRRGVFPSREAQVFQGLEHEDDIQRLVLGVVFGHFGYSK